MSNTDQRSPTSGTDHINTLPNECLAEIFAHAGTPVPQHNHPYRVIILGSVCSRWRAVTLDWPALWSKIYIPVNVVVKGSAINRPRYERSAEDERWTSKLRDAVELYLTRSKTCAISVHLVKSQKGPQLSAHWELSLENLAGLFHEHMYRCYELHVLENTPRVHSLLSDPDLKMPLLKSLTLPKVLDLPFIRSATKLQMIRTESIEPGIKDFATVKSVELATHKPRECLLHFPKVKMVTLLAQAVHLPVTGRVVRSNFVSSLTVVATWDTIATIQEMLCKVEFPNLKSLKLVHLDCPGPPLHSSCIRRPLVGTLSLNQLVFQGFAIRSQDLLDILGMAPRLTSLSINDSSYPLVGPYRPISSALLVALADPKIVPDLERLQLYWRHDVDIDGSLVARLLETRGNRLADVVIPKRRATV
ncbi:hypothetical protein ARMSODRAFT_1054772 [Armillaria solidipes]|uniref:F-box domain-containing protein n=1 Tax=Armillaria solidipes TaxID=1076256 RepID=A0A2H3BJS9_9AGAR|nr:hypothetical protein ARMSODRAFT_1054772 [Armillaria solidipes]